MQHAFYLLHICVEQLRSAAPPPPCTPLQPTTLYLTCTRAHSLDENGNPYVVLFVPAPTAIQCFECEGGLSLSPPPSLSLLLPQSRSLSPSSFLSNTRGEVVFPGGNETVCVCLRIASTRSTPCASEREREKEKELRGQERECARARETDREREGAREREREGARERESERASERDRARESESESERERVRASERARERQRETTQQGMSLTAAFTTEVVFRYYSRSFAVCYNCEGICTDIHTRARARAHTHTQTHSLLQ